mmetsp:Transcript_62299/g.52820  ORF Transcript_62299/g.52820 Transcript_62299/m.52820 type:complete len:89 (+) Transcript_62299:478-744(+)
MLNMIQNDNINNKDKTIVILLDHILDTITGIDVMEDLRKQLLSLKIKVVWVLVSSTEDTDTLQQYIYMGVERVITKPLSTSKIKDLMV